MTSKNILCFGDSLTWGWVPVADGGATTRYDANIRWTGVLSEHLGPAYRVIEEGLSGRTVNIEDPIDDRLNASTYLAACLASHLPLDLVVLMLGTNDTKSYFDRDPVQIAAGMAQLTGQIRRSAGGVGTIYPAPKVLLMSPPPLMPSPIPWFQEQFAGAREKTQRLAGLYKAIADYQGLEFMNAGEILEIGGADGVHLSVENNKQLGITVAEKVKQILL